MQRRMRSRISWVVVFTVVAVAVPARAQQPGDHAGGPAASGDAVDPASPRGRAQPVFLRGLELVQLQRWSDALGAFLEAQRIFPSPVLAFNIGYCQRALGQHVDALRTLRQFLAQPLEGAAATRREEAVNLVHELERRVARIVVAVPADLRAAAEVLLDGRTVRLDARGEMGEVINPGRHTVHVRHEGYAPLFEDRDVGQGASVRVDVRLRRLPARLVITSNVLGATVRLDGALAGRLPFDAETLPGSRRLEVAARGYVPHRSLVNLTPGVTTRLRTDLARERFAIERQWWFWTGISVVATAVALIVWAATLPPPQPPPYDCGTLNWCIGVMPMQ
jgi:hypothetical protein